MAPETLLLALQSRGVILVADGTTLRWRAPAGVVSDADRDALAAAKPALLALLAEGEVRDSWRTLDAVLRVFPDARVVNREEAADDAAPATRHPYGSTPPPGPCSACGALDYHRAGSGWTCSRCHPAFRASNGPRVTRPGPLEAEAERLYRRGEAVGWPTLPLGRGVTLHAGPTAWARFLYGVGPEWLDKVWRALEADNGHPDPERCEEGERDGVTAR